MELFIDSVMVGVIFAAAILIVRQLRRIADALEKKP